MKDILLSSTTAAGKPLEIWFQDEARAGQKGTHTYVWAPVGSCPLMVRDNRHDSVHLFGAICPARGVGAAIIMPAVNTGAMNGHLKEIGTQAADGAHAVLILDGAGWHQTGGRPRVPDNITLLPLPPYAPELNPMQNVWEYPRGNKLSRLAGIPMKPSSMPARRDGTSSSMTQTGSDQSGSGTGHVSMFGRIGIRAFFFVIHRFLVVIPRLDSTRCAHLFYQVKSTYCHRRPNSVPYGNFTNPFFRILRNIRPVA